MVEAAEVINCWITECFVQHHYSDIGPPIPKHGLLWGFLATLSIIVQCHCSALFTTLNHTSTLGVHFYKILWKQNPEPNPPYSQLLVGVRTHWAYWTLKV